MSNEFLIEDQPLFTVWDYVVFSLVLAVSAAIGLAFAFSGGKQKSTKEYLLANRSMSALPVAMSILASMFSATTMLGTPAEVYLEGAIYWLQAAGASLGPFVGAFVFGPYFYKLKIVSVFEYLELRYNSKSVRILAAILYILKSLIYGGVVLLGPATAFNEVTGFPIWAAILTAGGVCAFYTTLGGIKAVIWNDVVQVTIMIIGMSAILIQGSIEVGGFGNAWRIAEEGGRINFNNFDPDPTVQYTFWTVIVGTFFTWIFGFTVDQVTVQRFNSTRDLKQARMSLLLNTFGIILIMSLATMAGVLMYAYYADCDPLSQGTVTDPNQLMARFAMDILYVAPGMSGLFIASLFSGALSSVSSLMNSLSAVTWEDIFKQCVCTHNIRDELATTINKCLGLFYAVLSIGFAFVFTRLGGTVMQISLAFNGAIGAPLVGIYILGIFFPWTNWIGAFIGALCGFALPMWINLGAFATDPDVGSDLPFSVEGCPMVNVTENATSSVTDFLTEWHTATTAMTPSDEITGINKLYTLSYLYYAIVGILVTIFIGLLVSFMSGYTRPGDVDPKYMMSYVDTFWPCFPKSCREKARCGVQYETLGDELNADKELQESDMRPIVTEAVDSNALEKTDVGVVNLAMNHDEKTRQTKSLNGTEIPPIPNVITVDSNPGQSSDKEVLTSMSDINIWTRL